MEEAQAYATWRKWRESKGPSFVLEPETTAFVVTDMQYASACRTTGKGKVLKDRGEAGSLDYRFTRLENIVVPNIARLLGFFRQNKLRIIYVTLGSEMPDYSDILPDWRPFFMATNNTRGNREHEILDEIKPHPGECVINKLTGGAFNSSNIDLVLRAMGIRYILFGGVSTHGCVETTARNAVDHGYRCIMVEDCCADNAETLHRNTLSDFHNHRGRVETTDAVIQELSRASTQVKQVASGRKY